MKLAINRAVATKTVRLDGRTFIVEFDANGKPLRIKERKKYGEPPFDGWYNMLYWSAKHHKLGKRSTIPQRILAAVKEV